MKKTLQFAQRKLLTNALRRIEELQELGCETIYLDLSKVSPSETRAQWKPLPAKMINGVKRNQTSYSEIDFYINSLKEILSLNSYKYHQIDWLNMLRTRKLMASTGSPRDKVGTYNIYRF